MILGRRTSLHCGTVNYRDAEIFVALGRTSLLFCSVDNPSAEILVAGQAGAA